MASAKGLGTTWYEINTRDSDKSREFYQNVFGYGHTAMDMGDFSYHMLTRPGTEDPFCGLWQLTDEMAGVPNHWGVIFHTPDVDETVRRVKESGGNIVQEPMEIEGVGRIGVCSDDQGGVFSIHQPTESDFKPRPMEERVVTWVEHNSPDADKAVNFYKKVFEWDVDAKDMGEGVGMYNMFHADGDYFAGGLRPPGDEQPPAGWMVYLATDDINNASQRVRDNGGQIIMEAFSIEGVGLLALATDSVGAHFWLHEPRMG